MREGERGEGRGREPDTWSLPSSVTAAVEVCLPGQEVDSWWQLRGQRVTGVNRPSPPHSEEEEEKEERAGLRMWQFDLEQLPTTYTNKWAIFRAQEGEERSHHGKYLMLWVQADWWVVRV